MTATSDFTKAPKEYTCKYSMLIDESQVAAQRDADFGPMPWAAQLGLTGANWIKQFTIAVFGAHSNNRVLTVHANATPGGVPCYFLPYQPDHAVSMTLGAAADWFFTSTLTGCTVMVHGPAAGPTIIHANARTVYNNAQLGALPLDPGTGAHLAMSDPLVTPMQKAAIEVHASNTAAVQMNALLPAALPGAVGYIRKANYVGKCDAHRLAWGKSHYKQEGLNYSFANDVDMSRTTANKPEVGVFVFGYRKNGLWKIYYQTTVNIAGNFKVKRYFGKADKLKSVSFSSASVVLGPPEKIFG